ncbi:MAG: phenylpyruvate tautomerase MIF-related protein [Desulfovermiculus sp.]|nr:phenylpyruvate tautomerase MIF-related protein [Desulfovermiculus sp.]
MPYFTVQTNQDIEQSARHALLTKASAFIADLVGKPESYVMVRIHGGADMLFGGMDEPAAYVQLKSIGLSKEKCPEYAEKICEFLEEELKVSRDRAFIDFTDIDRGMFALKGKTFA